MEKIYNKLVRDNIPEIIKADNAKPNFRILEQTEFVKELFNKLKEEVAECEQAQSDQAALMKEIGDIYQVLEAIIKNCGLDQAEILKLKAYRQANRGGFDKKLFLESVEKE